MRVPFLVLFFLSMSLISSAQYFQQNVSYNINFKVDTSNHTGKGSLDLMYQNNSDC